MCKRNERKQRGRAKVRRTGDSWAFAEGKVRHRNRQLEDLTSLFFSYRLTKESEVRKKSGGKQKALPAHLLNLRVSFAFPRSGES